MPSQPIVDPRPPFGREQVLRAVQTELERFGAKVLRKMTVYPPQAPEAKPVFARRGRRRVVVRGYRRTGTLRRSWHLESKRTATSIEITVATDQTAPYAVLVQGPTDQTPGQKPFMAARGWKSVPKEADALWPATEHRLQQILMQLGQV